MKIFSGSSNWPLVEKICQNLNLPIGDVYLHTFPSGEKYCQLKDNIRGEHVFLVQSTSAPANDNLMELLVMCDAARRASAEKITAVLPYFGYARQERKDKPRVPISAKLVMDMLQCAGVSRIVTLDLHAPQIQGFTNLPVDQLSFKPALIKTMSSQLMIDSIKKPNRPGHSIIDCVVAPDIGAVKRAEEYSSAFNVELVIISKKRSGDDKVELRNFIGDVKNKNVLIVDDMIESGGTIIQAAKACKEQGADNVYCGITHGCFAGVGEIRLVDAFKKGLITKLFVSNSVDTSNIFWEESCGLYGWGIGNLIPNQADKVITVDMAPWFAKAIQNINENKSVTELFQ